MKLKPGFELQEVANEYIIIPSGVENVDFTRIITLSESAAYLWREITTTLQGDVDPEAMATMLVSRYGIDAATAKSDVEELIQQWLQIGLIN